MGTRGYDGGRDGRGRGPALSAALLCFAAACSHDVSSLYQGKSGCDECVESQCGDEIAACEADPDCGPWRACRNACSDPKCVQECATRHFLPNGQFLRNVVERHATGGEPVPDPTAAVGACMQTSCTDACGAAGRDYSCTGDYDLPEVYSAGDTIPVQVASGVFFDQDAPPLTGVRVLACGDEQCTERTADAEMVDGVAELDIGLRSYERAGFDGHFRLRPPDTDGFAGYRELRFRRTVEITQDDGLSAPLFGEPLRRGLWESAQEVPFDADMSTVILWINDCRTRIAGGLTVEHDGECGQLPRCLSYYDGTLPDMTATETNSNSAASAGGWFSPGKTAFTVEVADTGQIVAQFELTIEADVDYFVQVWPMTRTQAQGRSLD